MHDRLCQGIIFALLFVSLRTGFGVTHKVGS
jgi:hypothetical protein